MAGFTGTLSVGPEAGYVEAVRAQRGLRVYRNILVAYDESEGAEAALGQAAELARGSGAALTPTRSPTR